MTQPTLEVLGRKLKHLDSGFFIVPDSLARKLSRGTLPAHGREKLVTFGTRQAWLIRTPNKFRKDSPDRGWSWAVYAIREAEKKT